MATIIPFKGLRPTPSLASQVAALPYDVCNVQEARQYKSQPHHFYHITRSEIDLPEDIDIHSQMVYDKAAENLKSFIDKGTLDFDTSDCYYIYQLKMKGRVQTGLVCGSSIKDYESGIIKKHEFTRPEKELDRINHIKTTKAQTGVVFLAYRDVASINTIIGNWKNNNSPTNDFVAEDGISHTVWVVNDNAIVQQITSLFETKVPATYIADGHHRAASAAKVAQEVNKPSAQYFLTCIFPESELQILDYNRVVKDLNGLSDDEFLQKLANDFIISPLQKEAYRPSQKSSFGLYLPQKGWYALTAKEGAFDANHPIESLDVSILQNNVLSKILNIKDPRTDKRVDFVGGIRGIEGLQAKVDSGEMVAAFSCFPVSLQELFDVADSGNVMPPKSTWFEPKTRDGLITYCF